MRSGRLNAVLVVERQSVTRGTSGQEIISWVTYAENIHAQLEPGKGFESDQATQILAGSNALIVLRWSTLVDGITAKDRFRHVTRNRNTIYNIVGDPINIRARNREVHFHCTSGANKG